MMPSDPIPRERMSTLRFFAYVLLAAMLLTFAICAASAQILRSLDAFFPTLDDLIGAESASFLGTVFAQLDHAALQVHIAAPAALSLVVSLAIGGIVRAGLRSTRATVGFVLLAVVVGLCLIPVVLGVSLFYADVNDIRFGDIVRSLIDMVQAGALDTL